MPKKLKKSTKKTSSKSSNKPKKGLKSLTKKGVKKADKKNIKKVAKAVKKAVKPAKKMNKPKKIVKAVKKAAKTTVKSVKKVAKPVKKAIKTVKTIKKSAKTLVKKAIKAPKRAKKPLIAKFKSTIEERLIDRSDVNPNGGELRVAESKFELGPKSNAEQLRVHNIPFEYGHNRIILLVVDPKFAFIYWEARPEKMHEAIARVGQNAKLTLRFHDMRNGAFWDTSIYERVGNWYLKLHTPNQQLFVELGMKNENGDFFVIARSNTMHMPRSCFAAAGPIKWMLVTPNGERAITEIEDYTDADLELLKKILGPYFFDLFKTGRFAGTLGSSAENIFMDIREVMPPSLSS